MFKIKFQDDISNSILTFVFKTLWQYHLYYLICILFNTYKYSFNTKFFFINIEVIAGIQLSLIVIIKVYHMTNDEVPRLSCLFVCLFTG